jgi:tetratricopeptide (TPR) repeat protein
MKQFNISTIISIWILLILIIGGCAGTQTSSMDADSYNERGISYATKGEYDKAIADFNRAIKKEPSHFGAYHNRGRAYLLKHKPDKAIADFNKALEINSENANTYYFRGGAYLGKANYDKAILDFSHAIDINPAFAMAYEMRAHAYLNLAVEEQNLDSAEAKRLEDKSISDFKKAEEIAPTIAEDQINRGLGYQSDTSNEFIFPAVIGVYRQRVGNLILGITTMNQAEKLLPAWPGHGPNRVGRGEVDISRDLVEEFNIKYLFNPMFADFILGFNKNRKLVLIIVSFWDDENAREKLTNMINKYQLKEMLRDSNGIKMQGEIMPCVRIEIFLSSEADSDMPVESAGYFYTCPTK